MYFFSDDLTYICTRFLMNLPMILLTSSPTIAGVPAAIESCLFLATGAPSCVL